MKGNQVISITSVDQVLRWWKFFEEGLNYFNKELKWGKSSADFFKVLLHVATAHPSLGLVVVLVSEHGDPYGYVIAADNTNAFSHKTANIYAVYTNKKCPSSFMELRVEAEQWARSNEYKEVSAVSYRINGASDRWFKKNLKYTKNFMVYVKEL